jgi:hypothetical protein
MTLADPKHDSLVAFTQAARVEPLVLIDTDVLFVDELHDVMQSLQSLFAGYYTQAIALNSTIGNVKVLKTLEKFTPNRDLAAAQGQFTRDVTSGLRSGLGLATEAYRDRLPTDWDPAVALEEQVKNNGKRGKQVDPDENDEQFRKAKRDSEMARAAREEAERERVAVAFGKDAISDLKENANLSVGKMIEVSIKHEDKTFTVPISIRLIANTIPSAKLVHILSLANEETSASERYHGWKSGRLAFFKDLLFCRDLIDAHRKNLMAHGDALFTNILAKERKNSLAALMSGNPSVAAASNMVVTSTSSIAELELSLNGHFSNFATRQKVFEKTSLMIVAVIDKEWSRVQFYHRGLPEATDVSFRDLKSSNKSGPDVSDILRAYQVGHSPSL